MTREEAIKVLEKVKRVAEIYESEDVKAYNMAIELLKQEPCEKDWRFYFDHGYAQAKRDLSCEEAISRQAVVDEIDDTNRRGGFGCKLSYTRCRAHIEQLPPATPQPKIGHWIGIDEEPHEDYECDKCGYVVSAYTANIEPHTEYKYCPNCGAKMQEVEKNG